MEHTVSLFFALSRILSASLLRTADATSSRPPALFTGTSFTPIFSVFLFVPWTSGSCCFCGVCCVCCCCCCCCCDESPFAFPLSVEFDELLLDPGSLFWPLTPFSTVRACDAANARQSWPAGGAFTGNRPSCDEARFGGGDGPSSSPISDNR